MRFMLMSISTIKVSYMCLYKRIQISGNGDGLNY